MSLNKGSRNAILRRIGLAFALVVLLAGASSAYADTILNYQITGSGNYTANFTLAMHPAPSGGNSLAFWFASLPVNVNGTWTPVTLTFDSRTVFGGMLGLFSSWALLGPQLYSGSTYSPTMSVGNFTLAGIAGSGLGVYSLTVTPATLVPEPTSFILLVTGLLALFGIQLLRRFA
jgi:hypothetical protein